MNNLMPGLSPRDLKRMLKRMGINVEELSNVERVEIITSDKEISIENPQVIVMKTPGQIVYQVIGNPVERRREEEISVSEEDLEFIVSQTGVDKDTARRALVKAGGDIAEAIMLIKDGKV